MIFLFFFAMFISLFILYAVSRHDFVLLRQSITLRMVFDNAFISFFAYLTTSRFFYILYTGAYDLFNPLKFFHLTRHWGLLPFAGILSIMLVTLFIFRKKKNKLRILDIFFISITPLIILDVTLYGNSPILIAIKSVSLLVLVAFYTWFITIHNKFTTKDGFITMMTLITYSLVTLAFSLATHGIFNITAMVLNVSVVIVVVVSSFFLFLIQKDILNRQ